MTSPDDGARGLNQPAVPGHSPDPPHMAPPPFPQPQHVQQWGYGAVAPSPHWPPAPPPRPPRQISMRWFFLAVFLIFALVATGMVMYEPRSHGSSPSGMLNSAADQLGKASALHLAVGFSGTEGRVIGADVTVTADLHGAGTVTDAGGGKADLVATSDHTAVRGIRTSGLGARHCRLAN